MFKANQRGHGHNSSQPWGIASLEPTTDGTRNLQVDPSLAPIKAPSNPSIPPTAADHSCARKQTSEFEAWRPALHVAFACRSSSAGVPPLPNPSPPPRLVIRITAVPAPIANEPPQLLPGARTGGRARPPTPTRAGAGDRSERRAATRDRSGESSSSSLLVFRFVRTPAFRPLRGGSSACCRRRRRCRRVAHHARPPNAAGPGRGGA